MAVKRIARLAAGAAGYSGNSSGLAVDSDDDRLQLNVDGTVRRVDAARVIAAGATLTLTAKDSGSTVKLDTAAGSVVTLPAATGSGAKFRFVVNVLATSNSHKVQVANATDVMRGIVYTLSDGAAAVLAYATGSTSDTITLNRSTTGSTQLGEFIDVQDIASGVFHVSGFTASTGTEATPFSAAVS